MSSRKAETFSSPNGEMPMLHQVNSQISRSDLGTSDSGVKLLLYYAKYLLMCGDTVRNNLQEHRTKQKTKTVAI